MKKAAIHLVIACIAIAANCPGQERPFKDLLGPVKVGAVASTPVITVPYIFWGGDMFTFYANGCSVETRPDSIYGRLGLKLKLVGGDNFVQQTRDYMEGKSPFLRGTFIQLAMASEAIGSDPRTKGVAAFQMTWSTGGDHCVVKEGIRTIPDLKGKTIALQKGGPHVGMLGDILETGKLSWDDIKIAWVEDITGPKGPAEQFKKDAGVSACFAVTPDMVRLTGGRDKVGTGKETFKGARVLVSTAEMTYSIWDGYAVRKDWADAHGDTLTKFAAGYLKAVEEVIELRKAYEKGGSAEYKKLLQATQAIFGKEAIPTLDDAHGLLCDCTPAGHPGNVAFFTEKGNLHGFEPIQERCLSLMVSRGYAKAKQGFFPSSLDWSSNAFIGYLAKTGMAKGERFKVEAVTDEIEKLNTGNLDGATILAFSVSFGEDQTDFSEKAYGVDFQRVVDALGKFGNAVIMVRGHTDSTKTVATVLKIGAKKGLIKQTGSPGNYQYSVEGRPLDFSSMNQLTGMLDEGKLILTEEEKKEFGIDLMPAELVAAALNLSKARADAVRDAIIKFAEGKEMKVDKSQIQAVGAGIREPFIVKPNNKEEAAKNRRVEFRLIRVSLEAVKDSDFNY
jgi:outer membrane protein OmpA-like peptidoglycan-associated protein